MRAVVRYEVPVDQPFPRIVEQMVPDQPQLVHFGLDPGGTLCVWAEVDTEAEKTQYRLLITVTGIEVPANAVHLRSCVTKNDVYHLFLLIPEEAMRQWQAQQALAEQQQGGTPQTEH